MDPLSITASVITIVQLATKITSACKDYIAGVKDAPTDLSSILIEVGSVKCVLETLELRYKTWGIGKELTSKEGPLEGCKQALMGMEKLLPPVRQQASDGKRRKLAETYATLAWPLKEGKARKLLEDLARHKSTISLMLTTETIHCAKKTEDKIDHLSTTLSDGERESILKWLVSTDPSSMHNTVCELLEPHTGKWLHRLPEYLAWADGPSRWFWLHGIPGAGKTVLASYIIEDVKSFCRASAPDRGWAYYYCYYGRAQDETHHFLRWIVNQLCRQSKHIPPEVRQLYRLGEDPSTRSLLAALSATLRDFGQVWIVVDALDESLDRQKLLNLLLTLAHGAFEKLKILALSRKEIDIERALEGTFSCVSLSNPFLDEDIRIYVEGQLRANSRFTRWPESLRAEIEAALTKGAKGMFRWAACQLDLLGRLNTAVEIRKALGELPETLDETHERILLAIPVEQRILARKALQFLCIPLEFRNIPSLDDLAEAVVVDVENQVFDPSRRLVHPESLLEICTCLITQDEGAHGKLWLAHYTVKEYLMSERTQNGPAASFHTSQDEAEAAWAKTLIIYLLWPNSESKFEEGSSEGSESEHSLHLTALRSWHCPLSWRRPLKSIGSISDQNIIIGLILRLLDPSRPLFDLWQWSSWKFDENPIWKVSQGTEFLVQLGYACYFNCTEVVRTMLPRKPDSIGIDDCLESVSSEDEADWNCTVLHVAAKVGASGIINDLLHYGASPITTDGLGESVLQSLCEDLYGHDCNRR